MRKKIKLFLKELKNINFLLIFISIVLFNNSCEKKRSATTGWEYNNPKTGGFEYVFYTEQETGPGLVFIEGGTFVMGRVEQDLLYEWHSIPRRVTVPSFYMDETEIRNVDYREYLYWLKRVFVDYPEVYKMAHPDTLVWRRKLAYNEPYVEYYFRHPAYQEYPVVGVNWRQANDYCAWRTDRVNEWIMIREGLLYWDPTGQQNENNFNTEAYLAGQYEGAVRQQLPDLDPNNDFRRVRMEDGILLPKYRLPTEAEWEFAALGLIGNMLAQERIFNQRIYPWNGHYIRVDDKSGFHHTEVGKIRANIMRGRGDYMGMAGALNDGNAIPGPVTSYWPNDYGLYCMAGNVNEWVMDVYRPLTYEDAEDFRPFRGNVFKTQVRDEEGNIAEKDSLGRIRYRNVTDDECFNRRNYNTADNINYLDGDFESSIDFDKDEANKDNTTSKRMYYTGKPILNEEGKPLIRGGDKMTSMIDNRARVYKGGSWRDRAYWMSPGTRRFLDEEQAQDDLGFRCAMHRVGSQIEGEYTKKKNKSAKRARKK